MSATRSRPAAGQVARLAAVAVLAVALGFGLGFAARERADAGRSAGAGGPLEVAAMRDAMGEALLEPDTLRRARALDDLLARMDADNAAGVEQAFDPIIVGVADCDVEAYVHARAVFDPRGAFEHALRWPSQHKRGVGVLAASWGWAQRGGALEARVAVEELRGKQIRKSGLFGLLQGWARSDDVEGATQFLARMPDDEKGTRNDLLTTFVTSAVLAYDGPEALVAWFDAVPHDAPNGFKRAAFRNALLQLAGEDPERAIAFYRAQEGRAYREGSLWLLAVAWQQVDPEAAFAWLEEQGPGDGRNEALIRALQRWSSRDRAAAARWLAQADLEDDPELRRVLHGILRKSRGSGRGDRS